MKKFVIILLCISALLMFAGCKNAKAQTEDPITMIGNPWSDWNSIEEAESAVGFSFDLPAIIADTYTASKFRTMTGELIEVIYSYGDVEVHIRKQYGEGNDISGDYNEYENSTETTINNSKITVFFDSENNAVKQIISCEGYSWSVTLGYGSEANLGDVFLNEICK